MLTTVKTFNAHNIHDGTNYRTRLLNPHGVASAVPVFLEQANSDSLDAGLYTVDVQTKVLSIEVINYSNRYALIAQLKAWFKRGTQGNLVVSFADDTATDYQISCRVVSLAQDPDYPQIFTAILQTGTSEWRAVTLTTHAMWTATGTTETEAISVGGKDETLLNVDITAAGGPASGYLYQNIYRLPNTPGLAHGLIPWCLTVNTAALVSGGKMQADCDDLRVVDMNTGQELKRWIANPNNASTKVWINLDLAKGYSLTLLTSVSGVGVVSELKFVIDDTHKAAIAEMPKQGIVYHNNEWFAYSDTDPVTCRLIVSQRGLFGTTVEAHSAGQAFLWIQYPLLIKYGNASVSAPSAGDSTYDLIKPLIDLANSSNTQWVWGGAGYPFFTNAYPYLEQPWSGRTAQWSASKRSLGVYSLLMASDASLTPAIFFRVMNFYQVGNWAAENVEFTGTLFRAAGITSITATGKKMRRNDNWLTTAGMRASLDGVNFSDLFAEASPSVVNTYENWTNNSTPTSTPTGAKYVQLAFIGGYPAAFASFADFYMLTCSASFNSSNVPTGAFLGEQGTLPLIVKLENETTGDVVYINYLMAINKKFSINGETKIVTYDGYSAYGAITLDDEGRSVYIRLQGGVTNTIRITGDDLGTLHIDLSWYARRL